MRRSHTRGVSTVLLHFPPSLIFPCASLPCPALRWPILQDPLLTYDMSHCLRDCNAAAVQVLRYASKQELIRDSKQGTCSRALRGGGEGTRSCASVKQRACSIPPTLLSAQGKHIHHLRRNMHHAQHCIREHLCWQCVNREKPSVIGHSSWRCIMVSWCLLFLILPFLHPSTHLLSTSLLPSFSSPPQPLATQPLSPPPSSQTASPLPCLLSATATTSSARERR